MTGCPRCAQGDYGREKRTDGVTHRATTHRPSIKTMTRWASDCGAEATDGCWVAPDGSCQHGHTSWIRRLGYV